MHGKHLQSDGERQQEIDRSLAEERAEHRRANEPGGTNSMTAPNTPTLPGTYVDERRGSRQDEPGRTKVEPVDEGLNEPDRIVRPDIIIHRLGQQQELRAVRSS